MDSIKKPFLYSYVFGIASIAITAVCLAGVYLPMRFSTPFFEAVRASTNTWFNIFFSVPAVSLAGIIRCRGEWKREQGGTAVWWINCIICWGMFLWSVCMISLGAMLALFMKKYLL